jgi:hypothetical protein
MLDIFTDAGGAYVLYCTDVTGLGRVPVLWSDGREDPSGVLRIGRADVIRERSADMRAATLTGSPRNQTVADAFANPKVRARYPAEQLWVAAIWYPNGLHPTRLDDETARTVEDIGFTTYRDDVARMWRTPHRGRWPWLNDLGGVGARKNHQLRLILGKIDPTAVQVRFRELWHPWHLAGAKPSSNTA